LSFLSEFSQKKISIDLMLGIFFLSVSLKLFLFMIKAFMADFTLERHKNFYVFQKQFKKNAADILNFETFLFIFKSLRFKNFEKAKSSDLIFNLLKSDLVREVFLRLAVTKKDFDNFLKNYDKKQSTSLKEILEESLKSAAAERKNTITLFYLLSALFEKDIQFKKFLFEQNVKKEELFESFLWMSRIFNEKKSNKAWWSKENLFRIPGIAADWAYGSTPHLDKYSYSIGQKSKTIQWHTHLFGRKKEIQMLERILSKNRQKNAILVGEPGTGKETLLIGFAKSIRDAKKLSLKQKHLIQFNWEPFIADTSTGERFEKRLIVILNEVVSAGNIILIIDNFPEFLASAERNLKVNAEKILELYLASPKMQIIAISDEESFKREMEFSASLMKFFEPVRVKEPAEKDLEKILEDVSLHFEKRWKIIVTYKSIKEIINSSQKYITQGSLPERAIDLLEEVVAFKGGGFILAEDVLKIVKEKTNIPLGKLSEGERGIFLNLAEVIHQRVVNQDEAVRYVANSLKRSRANIQSSKRPIGSFLFLGPTGVGKTETAKAVSEAYFGKNNVMRLDMSEYSGENALMRLIGSFEKNIPGELASFMRKNPYSLLLLDEFEKANNKVGNLFLQILEDGFFTDAFGKKINMRNIIIIATSNAGSNLIWELTKKGIDPSSIKERVIDNVRKKGFFKPELLNRFDAIVIYHPLSHDNLKKIASLMLLKLQKRLQEKDIFLAVDSNLIEAVVKWGYNPLFGARPMRRAIQDKIENVIAEKIIKGEITRGSKIKFSKEELEMF
jgi:ATP-dependent Clp protease ATP-binding subunit ClpC